jgi:hypothetical protein
MSHLMKGKVYGLSLPKAKAPVTGQASRVAPLTNSLMNKKASIFNQSDSDSDNSGEAQNARNSSWLGIRITLMRIRIRNFTSVRIRMRLFTLMRIRILLRIKFRESATTRKQILWGCILSLHVPNESVHSLLRHHLEPTKLLNFDFSTDPDPTFHFNANANLGPDLASLITRIRNSGAGTYIMKFSLLTGLFAER